jgi:hypothetical protein
VQGSGSTLAFPIISALTKSFLAYREISFSFRSSSAGLPWSSTWTACNPASWGWPAAQSFILGSVERAELLINRIDAERKSVNRAGVRAKINAAAAERQGRTGRFGAGEPSVVPAE